MKPAPFEYFAPESLAAALALLAEHGDDAKLLAGGQSLIPAMNFRLLQPEILVDLNPLTELNYIRQADDGSLRIGAMTRQSRLGTDAHVVRHAPLLAETIPYIAHPQIRSRGTLGGSLVHADPAAELPVIMVALGAQIRVQSTGGDRWVPADEFFWGLFATDTAPEEILVEVALPPLPARTGWSFMELARRRGDYAMMGVAALVTLDGSDLCAAARLVYLNAGDGPVDAQQAAALLVGQVASPEAFAAAAMLAAEEEIDPLGSMHASVAYQRHLAGVLTRRALARAFARAAGEEIG